MLTLTLLTVPTNQYFSANQQFVGTRANNFWQYGKHRKNGQICGNMTFGLV